jgi:leucyl aminopeptidase (aminopeptidase T)
MTGRDERDEIKTADHVLTVCGGLKSGERVTVVADYETADIAGLFVDRATRLGAEAALYRFDGAQMHGVEPGPEIADAMLHADLILGLTKMSLAHTDARHVATNRGARYLSLPDYSWTLMKDPSLSVDFLASVAEVEQIANLLSAGRRVRVTSAAGTDVEIEIDGRLGNACPGIVHQPGTLGSPPDIEANVAPLENGSNGRIVVDGSIPCREIGLLDAPVELTIEDGRIVAISGNRRVVEILERMFQKASDASRILAECGIGLNREARLQGNMLTDEGAFGCIHFGFGSNATIGGQNRVAFHLDFVCRQASLSVDGNPVMTDGALVL